MQNNEWIDWLVRLQSLAQAGLAYGKDKYDIERFEEIRTLTVKMMASLSDLPEKKIKNLFANETGYQTPKIDTRAAIFKDEKILLVQERDGTWALPGGWCDVDQSVMENTLKEVKEEAGLDAVLDKVIAIQDRDKHNQELYAYKICKIFSLCHVTGGAFTENLETIASRYFSLDKLPVLAQAKTNEAQIQMCFAAYQTDDWKTLID
ncbi:NUDIX hydrolase N-terminal domain-containing protein [Streptococcus macacae]|uniref:Hydrolase of X-linked nucleoside pyrophosphate N-terminal domain protein n=1 Tax=Streptococcus macacae NCTC 11558 TaxID=764298 RepID=G5JVK3_9STRE|nr:NUDIX hydrolase [Streptococcus macacae]EHJ51636.1 hydrolase of X-linked nucleoside pyrophosphate N-terminal domain protein [Streptococcus macacae NCTC 11558]SUN78672.1 mutator protein MutT [Streptococcus macacae NCTC 11558]